MWRETRGAILLVDLGGHTSERLSSRAWKVLSVRRVRARFGSLALGDVANKTGEDPDVHSLQLPQRKLRSGIARRSVASQ